MVLVGGEDAWRITDLLKANDIPVVLGRTHSLPPREDEDVDFLIKFNPSLDFETYSDNYFALMYALQKLLNRDVELVAEETITNKYFEQSINESRVSIL